MGTPTKCNELARLKEKGGIILGWFGKHVGERFKGEWHAVVFQLGFIGHNNKSRLFGSKVNGEGKTTNQAPQTLEGGLEVPPGYRFSKENHFH